MNKLCNILYYLTGDKEHRKMHKITLLASGLEFIYIYKERARFTRLLLAPVSSILHSHNIVSSVDRYQLQLKMRMLSERTGKGRPSNKFTSNVHILANHQLYKQD